MMREKRALGRKQRRVSTRSATLRLTNDRFTVGRGKTKVRADKKGSIDYSSWIVSKSSRI